MSLAVECTSLHSSKRGEASNGGFFSVLLRTRQWHPYVDDDANVLCTTACIAGSIFLARPPMPWNTLMPLPLCFSCASAVLCCRFPAAMPCSPGLVKFVPFQYGERLRELRLRPVQS